MPAKDILIRLRANGEAFSADVKSALTGMEREVERQGASAGAKLGDRLRGGLIASTAAITAAAAGIGAAINQSFALAVDLSATSRQLGIGVEALQEYRNAARQTGVDLGALDENIGSLTKRIGEAVTGNRDAQAAFADLGVSFQSVDDRGRATEVVLRDIIDRLSAIDDPSRRAALGAQLLGDEYQKIEPLVRAGASGIDQMTDALRAQNGVLTSEQVELLRQANAEYDQLQQILSVNIAQSVATNAAGIRNLTAQIAGLTAQAIAGAAALGNFLDRLANEPIIRIRSSNQDSLQSPLLPAGLSHRQWLASLSRGRAAAVAAVPAGVAAAVAPRLGRGGGGGGGGGGGNAESSAAREAERQQREREQALQRETDYIQQQLTALTDAARIEGVRNERSEGAADIERARADFLRQHAAAAATTVEELARALGITGSLSSAERERLQTMIEQLDVIERQTVEQAKQRLADDRAQQEQRRLLAIKEEGERAREEAWRDEQARGEAVIEDLAGFYADLFSGSTGNIWDNFKRLGIAAVSEIAARWTLSRLAGQSFNLAGAVGGLGQQGGLFGSLLGGLGGAGGLFGGGAGAASGLVATQTAGTAAGAAGGLGGAGGLLGAAAPYALGALAAAQILPKLIGSLTTKKGSATLGFDAGLLTVGSVTGNSKSRKAAASGSLGNVIDALGNIADQLGGTITGAGSVSIGVRKKSYRVDTSGQGRTKGSGVVDFGTDQEAAIRYAIGEALRDGVIGGISDAAKRILASGKDLESAIEKAVSIEQLPKLLKARLDPLGAALDEVDGKYAKLAETLREGGASAEQIAQARQLWQLERDDVLKQIGGASATLRDYLEALTNGPNSPLSPRRQREAAQASFAAYESKLAALTAGKAEIDALRASGASADAIAAAEAAQRQRVSGFDQDGFTRAADQLLSTTRGTDASTAQFFAAWDKVRQTTDRAASLIEAATPALSARDPFAELTATAAQNTVNILDTQTGILNAINDNLVLIAQANGLSGSGGFIGGSRNFA